MFMGFLHFRWFEGEIFGIKRSQKTPDIYKSVDDALKLYKSLSFVIENQFLESMEKTVSGDSSGMRF
jgi:hypothetical protein